MTENAIGFVLAAFFVGVAIGVYFGSRGSKVSVHLDEATIRGIRWITSKDTLPDWQYRKKE